MQIGGNHTMLTNDEREFEYYDWEKDFGREEAIRIASEEWGMSTYQVEMLVKRWEDMLWL